MMRRSILALAILGALPASAETLAPGQPLSAAPGIARYVFSQAYMADAHRTVVQYDRLAGFACAGQYTMAPHALAVGATIEIPPGAPHPATGTWRAVYDVTRCERVTRYSLFYEVRADGVARVLAIAGQTNASATLLRDVWAMAVPILAAGRTDCAQPVARDTRISRPAAVPGGAWQEEWDIVNCGPEVAIQIDYTPSPRGGTDFAVRTPARPR